MFRVDLILPPSFVPPSRYMEYQWLTQSYHDHGFGPGLCLHSLGPHGRDRWLSRS